MTADLLLALFVQYGYWIVFVGILLDNAGLPLPGELLLLTLGALARTGDLDVGLGVLAAWAAAVSGDSVGYWLGRLGGERALHAYCRLTLGSGQCVRNAVSYYERHGTATVMFGRFVMGVRAFLTPLAGSARMPFSRFLLVDSLGALIWSGLFIAAGYSVSWRVERMQHGYRAGYMIVAGVLTASAAVYLLMKLYRRRRHGAGSLGDTFEGLAGSVGRAPSGSGSRPREPVLVEEARQGDDGGDGPPRSLAVYPSTVAEDEGTR